MLFWRTISKATDYFFKKKEWDPALLPPKPICPKCGTRDCISSEEYRKHMKVIGAGAVHVDSKWLVKSCKFRQQLIQAKQIVMHTRNKK